jgi:ribosome-associated protein
VTASRVEAVFDVSASQALTEEQRNRIAARLGPVVRAVAQDTRSQTRNRELALERLRGRLEGALAVQRPRRATKPTAASRRRRAESKRRRGEVKRLRRRPEY